MNIKQIPISDIIFNDANPRFNTDEAVEKVAESIKLFGQVQPLVISKNNMLIAGHTRYKALTSLGYEFADCLVLDLPENKLEEYMIVDNSTNKFSGWDYAKLVTELKEISLSDIQPFFEQDLKSFIEPKVVSNSRDKDVDYIEQFSGNKMSQATTYQCPHCSEEIVVK